jgi:hypothetical protein
MALGSLIKEQPNAEAEAKAAAEQREREEAIAKAAEEKAATQARLEQIEKQMEKGFQARNAGPESPTPTEAHQAQQALGLTEEQVDQMIAEGKGAQAVQMVADQIAANRVAMLSNEFSKVMTPVLKRGHKQEINGLREHPYFDDLEEELRDHFEANPRDMLVEGKVEEKFHELVGKNITRLQTLQGEREARKALEAENADEVDRMEKAPATVNRRRAVEPPIRPPSTTPKKQDKKVEVDPVRQELCDIYSGMGYSITPEEFDGIEKGELLPKKMSVDIQLGRRKSNVSY